MDEQELLGASRSECALYGELAGAYRDLLAVLAGAEESVDPGRVAALDERAERATRALRALGESLAPHRLSAEPVPAPVRAVWRDSAGLAAEAARLNTALVARARERQAVLAARMAELGEVRRGLAGYRPAAACRAGRSGVEA